MNPSSFSPAPETVSLPSKIETEKKGAFTKILSMLETKHKEISEMNTVISLSGKERALRTGSSSDLLAAKAQVLHRASEHVLNEVRGISYRQEGAAAKLEEFLHSYELFAMRYAELLESDTLVVEKLAKLDPNLELLARSTKDISSNDDVFAEESVTNQDQKYLVS